MRPDNIRVILTAGIPACGKSTWAKEVASILGFVELNLDDLRQEMSGDFTNQAVTLAAVKVRDQRLASLIQTGRKVIISDTNLHPEFRAALIQQVLDLGVSPEQVVLLHFPIEVQEAKTHNARRVFPVPGEVIDRMEEALKAHPPKADALRFGLGYAESKQWALA